MMGRPVTDKRSASSHGENAPKIALRHLNQHGGEIMQRNSMDNFPSQSLLDV
jgi:hypothetical protein